jgi:ABC-type branched-subunit amino acid transport system permease subunit
VVNIRLALASVILALAVAAWAYGVYCYAQMVRHRRPGVSGFTVIWPRERLTATGAEYRRRALLSYAAVVALLVSVLLLARLPDS